MIKDFIWVLLGFLFVIASAFQAVLFNLMASGEDVIVRNYNDPSWIRIFEFIVPNLIFIFSIIVFIFCLHRMLKKK